MPSSGSMRAAVHEHFEALGGRALFESKVKGDPWLKGLAEDILRPMGQIVHFVSNAEQIVVGRSELAVFRSVDDVALEKIIDRSAAFLEKGHPKVILVISKAAASVLDVRFLKVGRVAVFAPTRPLILESGGNVGAFLFLHASSNQGLGH